MPSNLICILADDHRASAFGHAGAEPVDTPSLDALAAAGCRFPQLRIEGGRCRAVCIPTRASLITGCSVVTACADPEGRTLKADAPLLPALLRRRGYHCEHIGKWHQDLAALRRGFDHGRHVFTAGMADHRALPVHAWEDLAGPEIPPPRILPQYSSEAFADEAVAFLGARARQGGTPFFLQLALTLPHDPFDPPPGWSEPPEADWPPLPPDFQPRHPFDIGDLEVRDEQLLPWPRPEREVRRMAARYHAMIAAIDAVVGRIVQTLQRTGLAGNTLLLYTGDHGLAGGRHGLLGKQNLYECALRVPGILAGPGIPAGKAVDVLASQLDLAPTLLDLLGLRDLAGGMEGHSLRAWIEGATQGAPRSHHFARYRQFQRAVTDGRHKLIATRAGGQLRLQLFDLADDPDECRDLAGLRTSAPIQRELVEVLNARLREGRDPDFAPLNG
jgi:arylsulfatase A-like enzyme